jgi:CheY-like chemotaxis protein/HPt (histidine-containing phosphotransfer) domain-containing protein
LLLAEDNAVNQRIALLLLGKLGYEADVVSNGAAALDALRRERYDVVLMDVEMPEMDGLEASRRIHAEWRGRERPRIVAMTANAMEGDRETCLAAGMDDYVSKPVRREALAAALERCVPSSSLTETRATDGDPVLDATALDQLRETVGEEEMLVELIDAFLEEVPGMLAGLREADERGEDDVVRRLAHTLKSNARTFGAATLAERCAELEMLARDHHLGAESAGQVAAIAEELGGVAGALRRVGATG